MATAATILALAEAKVRALSAATRATICPSTSA
jgi:hypothetical protein